MRNRQHEESCVTERFYNECYAKERGMRLLKYWDFGSYILTGGVKVKGFLKFLCMCLIMGLAESAHAALPTVKDTVIISAADNKPITLAKMAEGLVD